MSESVKSILGIFFAQYFAEPKLAVLMKALSACLYQTQGVVIDMSQLQLDSNSVSIKRGATLRQMTDFEYVAILKYSKDVKPNSKPLLLMFDNKDSVLIWCPVN